MTHILPPTLSFSPCPTGTHHTVQGLDANRQRCKFTRDEGLDLFPVVLLDASVVGTQVWPVVLWCMFLICVVLRAKL